MNIWSILIEQEEGLILAVGGLTASQDGVFMLMVSVRIGQDLQLEQLSVAIVFLLLLLLEEDQSSVGYIIGTERVPVVAVAGIVHQLPDKLCNNYGNKGPLKKI